MPFELPNLDDATFPFQSRVYSVDWSILGAAAGGFNGVISGGAVTQSGSPSMSVAVASGRAKFNGVAVDFSADSVAITAADGTNPRWDLIVVDDNGDLQLYTGTAAASPVPQDPATISLGTEVGLALVYVPANDTAITNSQISDRRITVAEPLGATQWNTLSVAADETRTSTTVMSASSALQFAMLANTKYRVRSHVVFYPPTSSGGYKYGWQFPASPTRATLFTATVANPDSLPNGSQTNWGSVRVQRATDTTGFGSAATQSYIHLLMEGIIENGSNAGTFALAWAQSTSSATASLLLAGSYLEYEVA